MQIGYPFRIDNSGRTATDSYEDHVRHMIEQVLFTIPGERVNQPEFGSGLMQLVFGAPNDEMVEATKFLIRGSLLQWLGDLIEIEGVDVSEQEGRLEIHVRYTLRRNQKYQVASFQR
jgi:uncharacterized protein